ncbi:MAG: tRNA (N(6)-L-threonylcarbamoyladenosine(37)-C(2))-methylthiotransferase MtaB [Nitrospirota bacterium]|nr:tRNA (N(6)-L-threonylcarbamoyladenosine(37)-C(2))-methylthiotransferase MtaB [Nitrospirota bacterium]
MSNPLQMISTSRSEPRLADAPGQPLSGRAVFLHSMGCRVNRFDAAQLRAEFLARGCTLAAPGEPYDLYVLNTCTVTHQADAEARRLARRAKRKTPGATVAVTGCYAEVGPEALAAIPEIDLVIPNRDKAELVARIAVHAIGQPVDADAAGHGPDRSWGRDFIYGADALPPDPGGDTRLFLKVQEGCDVACAFCIIPTARGRSRSMPVDGVVATIRAAERAGYREAVLAGIHLGGYGTDLPAPTDFAGLLEAVLDQTAMPRIRFGSLEPWGLSERFVALFASEPRLLPSLHLPLQSGSASVLRRMRRPCTPEFYRTQVERILAAKPDLYLSTDVLTGFPGESDAEFEEGFSFIESLPFSHLHVFPYSPRTGTPAAEFEDPVPPEVRKARSERLIALSDAKRAEGLARQIGTVTRVLMEGDAHGHTHNNYLARLTPQAEGRGGEIVPVRITGHDGDALLGVPA